MNSRFQWPFQLSVLALLGLAGCSGISNLRPSNNSIVPPGPVNMGGEFRLNHNNSLRIKLDGADQTAAFNPVYATAPGTFSATMGLAPGVHTLEASGNFTDYILFFPVGQRFKSEQTTFTVPAPTLSILPGPGTTTVGSAVNVTVRLSQSQTAPVTVTLGTTPGGIVSNAGTTTVPAGATDSPPVPVTGVAAGQTTLNASAPSFIPGSGTISVNPSLSALAPASGPVGTVVTLTGNGFVPGGTAVSFGGTAGTGVSVASATSMTATVPPGLSTGNRNVTVTVAGRTSAARPFNVTATPTPVTPPAAVLFRTSAQDVQTFTFTPASGTTPASFSLVDTDAATAQGGVYAVGIAQTPTRLVRSSTADVQVFSIAPPSVVSVTSTNAAALSGTGTGIAISGTTVVRASETGIEVGTLNAAGGLSPMIFVGGTPSATGVGVDIFGTNVVRAHSGGIDLFSVGTPAAPVRLSAFGTGGGDNSATGTGVRFINATTVVRTFSQGVEIFDVGTNPAAPTRVAVNRNGFLDSAMGTAVAVEPGGGAVVRATSLGLERYTLPLSQSAMPVRSTGSRSSTTGVGVVVVGTRAFRATNDRLEAYNLPGLGAPVTNIVATTSSVGVGLDGR